MNSFEYVISIYIFIVGLCVGSFLNVVILRGLSGEEIVFSRSKCPKCGNKLKWYMNIPLISYIFLRGKCAFCKTKISFQYPLVEFITGYAFLMSYVNFGITLKALFVALFFSLFIVISATDFIKTVIIDIHAYILFGLALIYSGLNLGDISLLNSFLSGIGALIFFEILARAGILIVKYRLFGEGDSLIALGLGAIFGFKNFLILTLISIIIQSLSALPILILKSFKAHERKLTLSYIFVTLSLIYVFFTNYYNLVSNDLYYLIATCILTIVLIWSAKTILFSVKDKNPSDFEEAKEKFNLMPFGPAMILSAIICMFCLPQIKSLIKAFIS